MPKLFVSYRRKSWAFTHRLADELAHRLDAEIFVDLEGVDEDNFERSILRHLRSSDVVLLIVTEHTFSDRIHRDHDWVRLEIREALAHNIPIILVAVEGLFPPPGLPEDIKDVARKQGIPFYPDFFDAACNKLANFITTITTVDHVREPDTVDLAPSDNQSEESHQRLNEALALLDDGNYAKAIFLLEHLHEQGFTPRFINLGEMISKVREEQKLAERVRMAKLAYEEIVLLSRRTFTESQARQAWTEWVSVYRDLIDRLDTEHFRQRWSSKSTRKEDQAPHSRSERRSSQSAFSSRKQHTKRRRIPLCLMLSVVGFFMVALGLLLTDQFILSSKQSPTATPTPDPNLSGFFPQQDSTKSNIQVSPTGDIMVILPDGWVIDALEGTIIIATSRPSLDILLGQNVEDLSLIEPGEVAIQVLPLDRNAFESLELAEDAAPQEILERLTEVLTEGGLAFGAPVETVVHDQEAAINFGSKDGAGIAYLIYKGAPQTMALAILLTPEDEMERQIEMLYETLEGVYYGLPLVPYEDPFIGVGVPEDSVVEREEGSSYLITNAPEYLRSGAEHLSSNQYIVMLINLSETLAERGIPLEEDANARLYQLADLFIEDDEQLGQPDTVTIVDREITSARVEGLEGGSNEGGMAITEVDNGEIYAVIFETADGQIDLLVWTAIHMLLLLGPK